MFLIGALLGGAVRSLGKTGAIATLFGGGNGRGQERVESPMQWLGNAAKEAGTGLAKVAAIAPAAALTARALEGFSGTILARQRELSRFSGTVATAFAQLDRQSLLLASRSAQSTGGSTSGLADAVMQLREDTQPMKESMTNLTNLLGTIGARVGSVINKALVDTGLIDLLEGGVDKLADLLGIQLDAKDANKGVQGDFRDFLNRVSEGKFGNPINQTPPYKDYRRQRTL